MNNYEGLSPLAIAIQSENTKDIEGMLKILLLKPGKDYLVYLMKYLFYLLEMQNTTVMKFLDECSSSAVYKSSLIW